jgi:glycosyltransferase involved in cell wall biosynthesis
MGATLVKVLLAAYACEPGRGSEAGNGWGWATSLAGCGHEVVVLTKTSGRSAIDQGLDELGNPPNLKVVFVEVPTWSGRLLRGEVGFRVSYLLWQHEALKVARSLDKEREFDVVHHATPGSLFLGSAFCRLGKPFVFGPAGGGQTADPAFREAYGAAWRLERLRNLAIAGAVLNPFARRTVRRAAITLVTNNDTASVARRLGARRVRLFPDTALPDAFMPEQFPLRPLKSPLRILWVGRAHPIKGLPLALQAFSVAAELADARLVVVGGGPLLPQVPGWISALRLEGRVDVLGRLWWKDVKRLYETSDIFLFTGLRDSFGSQVLEAMAHGLPVVALDLHGVRDLVPPDAVIKVPATNPQDTALILGKTLARLAGSPAERGRWGRAAWEFARGQTWPRFAQQMTKIYAEIV